MLLWLLLLLRQRLPLQQQVLLLVVLLPVAGAAVAAADAAQLVIAYEPVWAIGTGEVAGPADAQEMGAAIRQELTALYDTETAQATRVLYGGSVKADNVAAIMRERDIDGVLVGGASLDDEEFANIVRFEHHLVTD